MIHIDVETGIKRDTDSERDREKGIQRRRRDTNGERNINRQKAMSGRNYYKHSVIL